MRNGKNRDCKTLRDMSIISFIIFLFFYILLDTKDIVKEIIDNGTISSSLVQEEERNK